MQVVWRESWSCSRRTLTLLSCSSNFPRASLTRTLSINQFLNKPRCILTFGGMNAGKGNALLANPKVGNTHCILHLEISLR